MKRADLLAALLPVLGVAALIIKAEHTRRAGHEFRLPIEGYDPRDMLRGHYLTYRIVWQPEDESCEGTDACCFCLDALAGSVVPRVRRLACDAASDCTARIDEAQLTELQRFYIPEDAADTLQTAVRAKRGAIVLHADTQGHAVATQLLIDGKPWREVFPSSGAKD